MRQRRPAPTDNAGSPRPHRPRWPRRGDRTWTPSAPGTHPTPMRRVCRRIRFGYRAFAQYVPIVGTAVTRRGRTSHRRTALPLPTRRKQRLHPTSALPQWALHNLPSLRPPTGTHRLSSTVAAGPRPSTTVASNSSTDRGCVRGPSVPRQEGAHQRSSESRRPTRNRQFARERLTRDLSHLMC